MLRVVFERRSIEKYRQKGVPVSERGEVDFCGTFVVFEGGTPCFEIRASATAEVFGQRKQTEVTLNWELEDIVSVAHAFRPKEFYWKKGWTIIEFREAHQ